VESGGILRSNLLKKEVRYSGDIDNSCNIADLTSAMYAALPGPKGEIVAVLQLANKQSEITEEDERKL
jgi:hypothetical protein